MRGSFFDRARARGGAAIAAGMALAAVCGLAAPAAADISPIVLHIRATNSQGTDTWMARIDAGQFGPDGTYQWVLGAPVELRDDNGTLVGMLTQGSTTIIEDPVVSLSFSVTAGAVDTTFQITSALLSFPAMTGSEGRASGQIGATDLGGDGVTLTGQFGGHMLTTRYNGLVPGGTTFADLFAGPLASAEAFGSVSILEESPATGFTPIPGTVTDISMQYFFTLSAGDTASGTATFVVLPAPGAAAVLGLAGVAGTRRRRQ